MGPPEFKETTTRIYLGTKSTSNDIEQLRSCPALKELVINGYTKRTLDTDPLRICLELEELQISNTQNIGQIDLSPLALMPNLRELVLVDMPKVTTLDLSPLSQCTSLQRIWIAKNNILELDIRPLLELEHLEYLSLHNMPLTKIDGTSHKATVPLKTLYLDFLPNLQQLSLDFLSDSKLEQLNLNRSNISHIDLRPISNQKQLQYLIIKYHDIKDIDLEPISGFSNLKRLDLACNKLKSIDLEILSGCTSLSYISIAQNSLDHIDLTPLKGLPLTNLLLSHNPTPEIDITPIISPKLIFLTFAPDTIAKSSKTVRHLLQHGSEPRIFVKYYHEKRTRNDGTEYYYEWKKRGQDTIVWY